MIEEIFKREFGDYLHPLKQISEGLADHSAKFYNYEEIADKRAYKDKNTPRRPDMALFLNDTIYFIEFKGGRIEKKEKDRIKLQAIEGCFIVLHKIANSYNEEITFENILRIRKCFLLVYDEGVNSREYMRAHVESRTILFDLELYDGTFFHCVETLTSGNFIKWLEDRGLIRN